MFNQFILYGKLIEAADGYIVVEVRKLDGETKDTFAIRVGEFLMDYTEQLVGKYVMVKGHLRDTHTRSVELQAERICSQGE
ncbi:MAG: hypothetical protein IKF82_01390 [Bacilli bacterium]|nr:hypothetical protein [Bacilli bacterium]